MRSGQGVLRQRTKPCLKIGVFGVLEIPLKPEGLWG